MTSKELYIELQKSEYDQRPYHPMKDWGGKLSQMFSSCDDGELNDIRESYSKEIDETDDNLNRFIEGQSTPYADYDAALEEISKGRKVSHWIWYVFPQLKSLGHSRRSIYYGIANRKEAEAYLRHPVLGGRLREITNALLRHEGKYPDTIFGSIDAKKVKSCMTLFDCISSNDIFGDVLDIFYEGKRDPNSIV